MVRDIHINLVHESWYNKLKEAFKVAESKIYPFLSKRKKEVNIYPTQENIYRAFKECSLDGLKVVWLLQNPYYDRDAANGLATDNSYNYIEKKGKMSPSLQNIISEITLDIGKMETTLGAESVLGHLPTQGVLLLNSALTVEKGVADSHMDLWKEFTEEVIKVINEKDDIIWCLWGAFALGFKEKITNPTHHFIISSHPSPLSARKKLKEYPAFIGSQPFSKINNTLIFLKKEAIKW